MVLAGASEGSFLAARASCSILASSDQMYGGEGYALLGVRS